MAPQTPRKRSSSDERAARRQPAKVALDAREWRSTTVGQRDDGVIAILTGPELNVPTTLVTKAALETVTSELGDEIRKLDQAVVDLDEARSAVVEQRSRADHFEREYNAERRREWVEDPELQEKIRGAIRDEWHKKVANGEDPVFSDLAAAAIAVLQQR